jgi:hypothetical protein
MAIISLFYDINLEAQSFQSLCLVPLDSKTDFTVGLCFKELLCYMTSSCLLLHSNYTLSSLVISSHSSQLPDEMCQD